MAQPNIFKAYVDSKTEAIPVTENIQDQTSTEGMTPRAMDILRAAVSAAADAGLAKIEVVAGKGSGHLSHQDGTEWDLVGRNADGSIWNAAQRVAVADGARSAGADRFGLYSLTGGGLGEGTLHMGYSGGNRPAAVWGYNGLTSGAASQQFKDPSERAFLASYSTGKPMPTTASAYAPTPTSRAAVATSAAIAPKPAPLTDVSKPNLRAPDLANAANEVFAKDGTIRKGAQGESVKEIQHFLNERGATDAQGKPLDEDGVMGTKTRQAVKDYQASHPELVVDGVVGPRTMTAMVRDSAEMRQPWVAGEPYSGGRRTGAAALASLVVTDPISEAMMKDANAAGVAAQAAAAANPTGSPSPVASAAADLGTNMAAHADTTRNGGNSTDFGAGVTAPSYATWPNNYAFHPGENRGMEMTGQSLSGFHADQFEAFNSLFSPHDVNPSTGLPYAGSGTVERDAEIANSAMSAYAQRLRDGPPAQDETQQPAAEPSPQAAERAGHGAPSPDAGLAAPADDGTTLNVSPNPFPDADPNYVPTPMPPDQPPLHDTSDVPFGSYGP